MKIDMHVHTLPSNLSESIIEYEAYRVKKVVDIAASKNLDAILFTDFNHIEGFNILYHNKKIGNKWLFDTEYEIKKQESAVIINSSNYKKPLTVFLGEEIRTKQGEVIGSFINDYIEPDKGIDETIDNINKNGGVVIFPHPLFSLAGGIGEDELRKQLINLEQLKAVEVFNGQLALPLDYSDEEARNIAIEFNAFQVGGSDAPYLFKQYKRVGEVYTDFIDLNELSKEAIKNYIKENCRTEITGNYNGLLTVLSTIISKEIIKNFKIKS